MLWPGIEMATSLCMGWRSKQLSHTSQGSFFSPIFCNLGHTSNQLTYIQKNINFYIPPIFFHFFLETCSFSWTHLLRIISCYNHWKNKHTLTSWFISQFFLELWLSIYLVCLSSYCKQDFYWMHWSWQAWDSTFLAKFLLLPLSTSPTYVLPCSFYTCTSVTPCSCSQTEQAFACAALSAKRALPPKSLPRCPLHM